MRREGITYRLELDLHTGLEIRYGRQVGRPRGRNFRQMEQHRHRHLSGETPVYSGKGKGKGRLADALHRVHLGE